MLQGILHYAHHLLEQTVTKGETVIDATCGNGNDSLFLSELTGDTGNVLAFDIQEKAIRNTAALLAKHNKQNVTLIKDSHANVGNYLTSEKKNQLGGAIFNLGYLPRGDKSIITTPDSTISAIDTILDFLKGNGLIVIVIYHGHQGGTEEKTAVLNFVSRLPQDKYHVLRYEFINQKNAPPFIVVIQKRM